MRQRASMPAILIAVCFAGAMPGAAQAPDNEKACLAQVPASAQAQIDACSALLASGRYNERNRAIIHNNRGVAQRGKGDIAAALADYDEAIRLYPDYARAYVNRGNARYERSELDLAIANLDNAIRLDAKNASAFISR